MQANLTEWKGLLPPRKQRPITQEAPKAANALGAAIRIALIGLLAGYFTVSFFPAYRVSLFHLLLVGGFAVIMFVVATRVIFGHSGNSNLFDRRNRWLRVAVGLMLFGMATRMSGDFWPKLMASQFNLIQPFFRSFDLEVIAKRFNGLRKRFSRFTIC